MGFDAAEAVESLDYNFNPHVDAKGTIPEPSTLQIETYRDAIIASFKELGIEPSELGEGGKVKMSELDDLISKSSVVEKSMLVATANLTGISAKVLESLPYRISRAFAGWIMGQFFSPEA